MKNINLQSFDMSRAPQAPVTPAEPNQTYLEQDFACAADHFGYEGNVIYSEDGEPTFTLNNAFCEVPSKLNIQQAADLIESFMVSRKEEYLRCKAWVLTYEAEEARDALQARASGKGAPT